MNGAVWFTVLDLKSGYCQAQMDEAYKLLMAFTVDPLEFYRCDHMPFKLVNALATFQRPMETCLGHLQLNWCLILLDNVIVFSKIPKDHLVLLRAVFENLKKAGLKLKPSECKVLKKSLIYLGHRILEGGLETDDSKIKVIQEWPVPKTVSWVKSSLGFTNYYCRFIYKYAQVIQPLYKVISGVDTSKRIKLLSGVMNVREPLGR